MKSISRKKILFSSTLGMGMLTMPDLFNQVFVNSKEIEFSKRHPKEFAERESTTDSILKILLYGIIAPNSHNTQPWKIEIEFSRICLSIPVNGFVFHIMNQAFVDYPESLEFQTQRRNLLNLKPDAKIQLGGRLGKADLSFFSPRRDLKEITF
jgi:hypothetical protein